MSKPETPTCECCNACKKVHNGPCCHCMRTFDKAEAPPAPNPHWIMPEGTFPVYNPPGPPANVSDGPYGSSLRCGDLRSACLSLRAQNAALEAESARRLSLIQQYEVELPKAKRENAALADELERLRDLIVAHGEAGGEGESFVNTCVDIDNEARAINAARAAREAGKA